MNQSEIIFHQHYKIPGGSRSGVECSLWSHLDCLWVQHTSPGHVHSGGITIACNPHIVVWGEIMLMEFYLTIIVILIFLLAISYEWGIGVKHLSSRHWVSRSRPVSGVPPLVWHHAPQMVFQVFLAWLISFFSFVLTLKIQYYSILYNYVRI